MPTARPVAVSLALCVAAGLGFPLALGAQGGDGLPDPADVIPAEGSARCAGETIDEIVIYSSAPTFGRLHSLPVIGAVTRATHVTTRPDIVRAFLLFREGDACTELARAESERVLRVQPFIADATIVVEPVPGGVRLAVHTIDETSLVLGARVHSDSPYMRTLRFGNSNVGGAGVYMAGEWRDGRALRDGAAIRFTDHQFLGQPYELRLSGSRAPVGGEWNAALSRPFYTGLQRYGWRASGGERTAFVGLHHRDSAAAHAVRVERHHADAGFMGRIGPPVRMGLVGLVASHEQELVGTDLQVVGEEGAISSAGAFPAAAPYRSTRINALVGIRSLSFIRVQGFDALTAVQDLPVGIQAGVMIGRGLEAPKDESQGRELFVAGDVYVGFGDSVQATRIQLRSQGVRAGTAGDWSRTVVTGRIAHQRKPAPDHLLELSADWAASWQVGIPLQLMIGADDGGVRGFGDAKDGGSRRARISLEDRYTIGNIGRFGDLGIAAFADAGRVWRGDSPFDVTTPIHASLGLSLLAAVPSRSARVWRVDFAMPMTGPGRHRLEVGLTRGDRSAVFWREPGDVATLRGRAVPSSVFAYP